MISTISFNSKYKKPDFEPINIKEEIPKIQKEPIVEINKTLISHKDASDSLRSQLLLEESYFSFFNEVYDLIAKFDSKAIDEGDITKLSKMTMKLDKIAEKASYTGNSRLSLKASMMKADLADALARYLTFSATAKAIYDSTGRVKPSIIDEEKFSPNIIRKNEPCNINNEKYPILDSDFSSKIRFSEEYDEKTEKLVTKPIK